MEHANQNAIVISASDMEQEFIEHMHPQCLEGPDPERGHDHYCMLEDEWCDDWECPDGQPTFDAREV